jgi:AhpD family alkylhydroperoxidase
MTQRLAYESAIPEGARALGGVYVYVSRCGLPKPLIDLVYLRASQINGCAYCMDAHTKDLIEAGVPVQKLAVLPAWREALGYFDEREQAALAWAETVTLVSVTHIPDEDYAAAARVFSPKELADLTLAIGLINTYNRLAIGFRKTPQSLAASHS